MQSAKQPSVSPSNPPAIKTPVPPMVAAKAPMNPPTKAGATAEILPAAPVRKPAIMKTKMPTTAAAKSNVAAVKTADKTMAKPTTKQATKTPRKAKVHKQETPFDALKHMLSSAVNETMEAGAHLMDKMSGKPHKAHKRRPTTH